MFIGDRQIRWRYLFSNGSRERVDAHVPGSGRHQASDSTRLRSLNERDRLLNLRLVPTDHSWPETVAMKARNAYCEAWCWITNFEDSLKILPNILLAANELGPI